MTDKNMRHQRQMMSTFSGPVQLLQTLTTRIRITDNVPFGLASPCWAWLGGHDQRGYARVRAGGRVDYVRRVVLRCQGVPVGRRHVISLCRDPGCVNPNHHLVGTKDEARAFGKYGHLAPTDFVVALMGISNGEFTKRAFARTVRMPERLLAEGMARSAIPSAAGVLS